MDRGRVGFNAIGNKCIRENMIAERRDTHLTKLKKIKNRRPGTSATVDCTPPKAIEAAKCNPRKKAISQEWSGIIEKENKALLQRISAVLTAPPKIDDGEYLKMRKICASLKSSGGMYEKKLQEKKTKEMFAQIKKIGPYYNPKQWELDYRRQLVGQKFMRQVNYKRPKDFVDPFAPPQEQSIGNDDDSEVRSKNGSLLVDKYRMVNAARSYSHMSVCRNVRRSGSARDKQNLSKSTPTLSLVSGAPGSGRNTGANTGANSLTAGDDGYDEYGFDEDEDADATNGIAVIENSDADALDGNGDGFVEEKRVMLAEVTRSTKIFDPSYSADHSFPLDAAIECFLLDNTTSVVIAAKTMDSVGGAPLVAEAEIDLNELTSIREDLTLFRRLPGSDAPASSELPAPDMGGMNSLFAQQEGDVEQYEYDMKALVSLATDIVNTVEIRVEDSIPRLVLNISLESIDQTAGSFGADDVDQDRQQFSAPENKRVVRAPSLAATLGRGSSPNKKRSEEIIAAAVQQSGEEMEDGLRQSESLRVRKDVVLVLAKATGGNSPHKRKEGGNNNSGGGGNSGSCATDTDEDLVALARSSDKLRCSVTVAHVADDKVAITVDVRDSSKLQWTPKKPMVSPKASAKIERHSSKAEVKPTAILAAGDCLSSSIGLPSIMQADMDLIEEYIENIFMYLSIEYDEMSETCQLKLK